MNNIFKHKTFEKISRNVKKLIKKKKKPDYINIRLTLITGEIETETEHLELEMTSIKASFKQVIRVIIKLHTIT